MAIELPTREDNIQGRARCSDGEIALRFAPNMY